MVTCVALANDPLDQRWELHASPSRSYSSALLGWRSHEHPIDAGVPSDLAAVFARALCEFGMTTFLHSGSAAAVEHDGSWHRTELDQIACVLKPPLWDRVRGRPILSFLRTARPSIVETMFDDGYYQWTEKNQIAFLSRTDTFPPRLDYRTVIKVLEAQAEDLSWLAKLECPCLVLPAVDGDFVELIFFDEPSRRRLQETLEESCGNRGIEWRIVSEMELVTVSMDLT
jgi:hypothetical protein